MMNTKLALTLIILAFSQVAFAGMHKIIEILNFQSRTIDYPEVGVEIEVEIGEAITSRALVTRKPALEITQPIAAKVSIFPFSYPVTFPVSEGLPLYALTETGKIYFKRGIGTVGNFSGSSLPPFPAIFVPNDKNASIEFCLPSVTVGNYAQCDVNPSISAEKVLKLTNINELSEESFKRELLYLGGDANSIQLGYREFKNDFARAAFNQDLKYDISSDKVVGFKGSRFEIQKATNVGLRVKVIKHLN